MEEKNILYEWLRRNCELISYFNCGNWFIYLWSESYQWCSCCFRYYFVSWGYFILSSLTIVSPNQAKAILFFGRYLGTIKENGLFITIPFTQNEHFFESAKFQ